MARLSFASLALILLAIPTVASAQEEPASLRIRVIDEATGEAIFGAVVGFPDLKLFILAAETGDATLTDIPPGDHNVEVTMLGYGRASALLHLDPGAVGVGEIQLSVQPIEIAGITVEGRSLWSTHLDRRGFYDRAKRGFGHHFDRTDIENLNAFWPSDILMRTPGMMSAARSSFSSGGCSPGIYVDGMRWIGTVDDLPITWIEGMEVFPRWSGVPIEYGGVWGGIEVRHRSDLARVRCRGL